MRLQIALQKMKFKFSLSLFNERFLSFADGFGIVKRRWSYYFLDNDRI